MILTSFLRFKVITNDRSFAAGTVQPMQIDVSNVLRQAQFFRDDRTAILRTRCDVPNSSRAIIRGLCSDSERVPDSRQRSLIE